MVYFIHIPRTGGTSIVSTIVNEKGIKVLYHNIKSPNFKLPSNICTDNDTAFAFVRNPYERLASSYFYLRNGGVNQEDKNDANIFELNRLNFNDFINKKLKLAAASQIHFLPQNHYLKNVPNLKVFKFENIDKDFKEFCELVKIGYRPLPKKNSSIKNPLYVNAYTGANLDIINKVYETDFIEYDYSIKLAPVIS